MTLSVFTFAKRSLADAPLVSSWGPPKPPLREAAAAPFEAGTDYRTIHVRQSYVLDAGGLLLVQPLFPLLPIR